MNTTISSKGQMVIPQSVREQARLRQGDRVDIGFADGLIVIRKHQPLTPAKVRALLAGSARLPEQTDGDRAEVASVVADVRRERRGRPVAA